MHCQIDLLILHMIDQVVPIMNWLIVEPSISILSICLPSIFSLMKRGIEHGPGALFTSKNATELYSGRTPRFGGTKSRKGLAEATFDNPFERLSDNSNPEYYAMAYKGPSKQNSVSEEHLDIEAIQVRRDINISNESASVRV